MDLPLPAEQLTACASEKLLLAACRDGSLVMYNLQDLAPLGRWALHGQQDGTPAHATVASGRGVSPRWGGCMASALVDGGTLLTAGGDGLLNVVEMVPGSVVSAAAVAAARKAAGSGGGGRPIRAASISPSLQMSRMHSTSLGRPDAPPVPPSPYAAMAGGFKSWPNLGVSEPLLSGAALQEFQLHTDKALTWSEAR